MFPGRAYETFPQLGAREGKNLKYATVFYEGQHNDSRTNIAIIINVEIAPVLPNSKVVTSALGISATIPAKIIKDIPFPIPLWVICSPSHIKKIVPATIVVTVDILKKIPGLITKLADDSSPTANP